MGGDPTLARGYNYWGEAISGIRYFEYRTAPMFATTQAGGIMIQPWTSELKNGGESVETSYSPVAAQNYRDGGRCSNQVIGNANITSLPTDGPFSVLSLDHHSA
jgi:hypothetical protein